MRCALRWQTRREFSDASACILPTASHRGMPTLHMNAPSVTGASYAAHPYRLAHDRSCVRSCLGRHVELYAGIDLARNPRMVDRFPRILVRGIWVTPSSDAANHL